MSDLSFEEDVILEPRRSARRAWSVATAACVVVVLQALAIFAIMPLKSTEVFSILVDKSTGQAERIVKVQPASMSGEEIVKESLLVAYVSDRESYFRPGLQERLESVERRSAGRAKESLRSTWTDTSTNESYPPRVYGAGAEVDVEVRLVNFLNDKVAQVRFTKTLKRPREKPVTRPFVATVEFEFQPQTERELKFAWENPLGFVVTNYSVDAETLTN